MDAYIYRAALWCGPCIIKALVAERKAAPGAIDISPAEVLQQIVSANGFTSENHYDSDDLPKGPCAEGGGEADAPQHCDGCGQLLGNPLTVDGLIGVENVIRNHLTMKKVNSAATGAVIEWADFYKDELTSAESSSKPSKSDRRSVTTTCSPASAFERIPRLHRH